jgi:prepilin-type N-terminal cleavage/methylation domain-containing protein
MGAAMNTTRGNESGFSLVESLTAMAILSVGMLGVAGAFLQGLTFVKGSAYDILAREKAAEAIESVFTARDTRTITWAEIRNVEGESGSDGGIFTDGALPLTSAGSDGMVNTADDGEDPESLVQPGVDGLLGTEDDVIQPLLNFTREVEISDIGLTLRQLRVIIRYTVGSDEREFVITTLISSYA